MRNYDAAYAVQVLSPLLLQVEGPCVTEGYIPCRPGNFYGRAYQDPSMYVAFGVSGVTIGTGVDLGQTDAATLRGYRAPENLIVTFAPYIGLKASRAILKLSQLPLKIPSKDAILLDAAVHSGYLARYVIPAYEKASGKSWDTLPDRAAAVIFSCCFQKGCGGVRRDWPTLWRHFCNQDWAAAEHELITGFKQYTSRRQTEGRWLASA